MMGAHWLHDVGQALSGLPVSYYGGWETRSRSSGGFDAILGVAIHHTASQSDPDSDMAYMWKNCSDRPVGNIYLARDGAIWVGTAGASNTQGKGGPLNCLKGTVPKDKGNQYMIAIEAANNGVGEAWPQVQIDNYLALVRQLCAHYGFSVGQDVYGHFDYCAPSCPGRKIDPAGPSPFGSVNPSGTWDINAFRSAVTSSIVIPPPEPPTPEPLPEENDTVKLYLVQDPRNGTWYVTDTATFKTYVHSGDIAGDGVRLFDWNQWPDGGPYPLGPQWEPFLDSLPTTEPNVQTTSE